MKFVPFLIALLLFFSLAHAQTADSLLHRYDSLTKSKLSSLDSTSTRINNKIDSLQLKANSILYPDLSAEQLLQRIRQRRVAMTDTVKARLELDSIKGGLQHKIDSLSRLNLPVDKYRHKLDSVTQLSPQKYLEQANGKMGEWQSRLNQPIDDLENKINKPINDLESKVNDKLALMNREGDAANIPGSANLKDVNLPGAELGMDNLGIKSDLKVPGVGDVNVPGVENIKDQLGELDNPLAGEMEQLGAMKDKVEGLKDIPQQQIDRLKSIDEVEAIQGKAGQANALIDKAQGYQQDVSRIAHGDLGQVEEIPKAIENRIASMDEMQELRKQSAEVTKYQEMLAKGNDPEALKGMAKEAAMKYATDHFAGKQEALKGAMDKMSKLKSKYAQVSSIKDLPKRVPNPMKGKPFVERIVPGLTFQIQKSHTLLLDLSPVASYRLTGRFNMGVGWNERISFEKWNKIIAQDRIYGPRVFSTFAFRKGFSLKAEVERMNAYVPIPMPNTPVLEGGRQWVWSAFLGFKKDYTFYKKIKGNVQVLYNVYDDHDNSPYLDRMNLRMGFEFPMKKRKKNREQ